MISSNLSSSTLLHAPLTIITQPPPWAEVLDFVRQQDPQFRQIESSLRRVLLRALDLPDFGSRATKAQLQQTKQWGQTHHCPLLDESGWFEWIETQLALLPLSDGQRRSHRCNLHRLVNLMKERGWLLSGEGAEEENVPLSPLNRRCPPLVVDLRPWAQSHRKRKINSPIALSYRPSDHLHYYRERFPDMTDSERLLAIQTQLERLHQEKTQFQSYMEKEHLRLPTIEHRLSNIDRLLGYRYAKNPCLETLALDTLIPVVPITGEGEDYEDFMAYHTAKNKAEVSAKKAARYSTDVLHNFFDEYGQNMKASSKKTYLQSFISLAKYLYRDITDRTIYSNFEDIPVVIALKTACKTLSSDPPRDKTLPLTWEQVREILEAKKRYVDDKFNYYPSRTKGQYRQSPRPKRHTALNLQQLLAGCLVGIIPPLRARTLAELEIGRTLKHGQFQGINFIPHAQMIRPEQALYYFDMEPEDYKTGKTYGHYRTVIPNPSFRDGTCFYDYLNQWLYQGYHQELLTYGQDHLFLFVRARCANSARQGDPIPPEVFEGMIADLMKQFTGIEIYPHAFRAICRTYYTQQGATREELDSLAYFMQHSPFIAERVYDRRSSQERSLPILNFLQTQSL